MKNSEFFPDQAGEKIEGFPSARMWPFIRTTDVLSSNSYVISAGAFLLVVDPGADNAQMQQIYGLLQQIRCESDSTVMLLLTHCHRDHSLSVTQWMDSGMSFLLLAHETGAEAMQSGETVRTLAYIYGEQFPPIDVSIPLSFSTIQKYCTTYKTSGNGNLDFITNNICLPSGITVDRQVLKMDETLCLEIYHSPGHSPDSLCYRLGDLLFIGDILFADKPGVAGVPGWSQPCLLKSLDMIEWLIKTKGITRCCPGHGPIVPAKDVMHLISSAKKNASRLKKLICLDNRRVTFLKACAETFIHEAGLLLAVLGGRLYLLAERLEALDETRFAAELIRDIDLDRMENFIRDFQLFSESAAESGLQMAAPLQAVNTINKIQRTFQKAHLPAGVAEVLLQRIEWLLRDYISIVSGLDLSDHLVEAGLGQVLQEAIAAFAPFSCTVDEACEAADTAISFAGLLAQTMDFRLQLPRIQLKDEKSGQKIRAKTDPHRLKLLFIDVLEQLAVKEAPVIHVAFQKTRESVITSFSIEKNEKPSLSPNKIQYYSAMMDLLGGRFALDQDGAMDYLRFYSRPCRKKARDDRDAV